jgi:hypothetical protein
LVGIRNFTVKRPFGSKRDFSSPERVEIHPVGPEMVEGVRGNLYRVILVSGDTRGPPVEVVIATDPRLAPIGQEFSRLAESMTPAIVSLLGAEPQVLAAIRGLVRLGAPLRVGNEMRLDMVSTDDVPDSRFALPGPVMSRAQLQQVATMMTDRIPPGQRPPDAPASPGPAPGPGNAPDPQ